MEHGRNSGEFRSRDVVMLDASVIAELKQVFPEVTESEFRGDVRVVVPRDELYDVLEYLRDEHGFDLLVDVTCVDYLAYRDAVDRFGLVYLLANTEAASRITVRTFVNEPDLVVPSVYSLWKGADWMEREVYDMFGILFEGHPDLRRILLPDEFAAFPLRKDYPMQGRGERHNFPVIRRGEA